ncbi:ferritin-like fold-containing protein [Georgenia wangjunii]|uniref:ferritin-like fold-containing protein n=1 Tax=Georgenia wangjunii TaxID=3117730 RepID=UPI002F260960
MPDATDPSGPTVAPEDGQRALALLGLVTAGALASFARLADDAVSAPDVAGRLTLTRMAGESLAHLDELERAIEDRAGDPAAAAGPFLALLGDLDARTTPRDWWERLMRTYVAGGMVIDLQRAMSAGLDGPVRALARDALVENGHADYVVRTLAPVVEAEPQLAARLALWGRRVAGEALSLAQNVVRACPLPAGDADGAEAAVTALVSAMTGGHARRMGRLGLTA